MMPVWYLSVSPLSCMRRVMEWEDTCGTGMLSVYEGRFDRFSGEWRQQRCEAAWRSAEGSRVHVLPSPPSLQLSCVNSSLLHTLGQSDLVKTRSYNLSDSEVWMSPQPPQRSWAEQLPAPSRLPQAPRPFQSPQPWGTKTKLENDNISSSENLSQPYCYYL